MTDKELLTAALGPVNGVATRRHIHLPEEGELQDQVRALCARGLMDRVGAAIRTQEDTALYLKMCDQSLAREAGQPWKTTADIDRFARSHLSEPIAKIRYHATWKGAEAIGVELPGGLFPHELEAIKSRRPVA